MRVVVVHNRSRRGAPSGEEVAVATEVDAMRAHGWQVDLVQTSSDDLVGGDRSLAERIRASPRGVWNLDASRRLRATVGRARPDVVHVHNDFPQLGPAIHQVLATLDTPYVQSIHNYRFACVNGSLYRDGHDCTECVGRRLAAPGIRHRCGGSAVRSAYVAGWIATNDVTRSRADPLLVANSRYVGQRLVDHGVSSDRVTHRYNLAWPAPGALVPRDERRGVVAAGRLDPIKGIDVLVEAWLAADPSGHDLTIVGSGPQEARLRRMAAGRDDITIRGALPHREMLEQFARARLVVVPSRWPEPFGRVAMEAMHHGTPALVADVGGLAEAASPMLPELVVPAGDAAALADRLAWALDGRNLPSEAELAAETESRFGLQAFLDRTRSIYRRVTTHVDE